MNTTTNPNTVEAMTARAQRIHRMTAAELRAEARAEELRLAVARLNERLAAGQPQDDVIFFDATGMDDTYRDERRVEM